MRLSGQFQFFLRKDFERKKTIKTQTNTFHPLKWFCVCQNWCLCCLVFSYFCFVSWFSPVTSFLRSRSFRQKKIEIVLITSNTILLTCTHINPLSTLLWRFYFYSLIFTSNDLCESLLFMRIFLSLSYLWESLLVYDHLWQSTFLLLMEIS